MAKSMEWYDVYKLVNGQWTQGETMCMSGDRKAIIQLMQGSHQQSKCGTIKVRLVR